MPIHFPWHHATPEEEAAALEQARLKEELAVVRQAAAARQAADLQALAAGGIPTTAATRLSEIRDADPEHSVFSSNLSPDEAALLRRNGYRPLGLVTGSAMYNVGAVYPGPVRETVAGQTKLVYRDYELTVLSHAYNESMRLAVIRMQQEATAIGAHGVVGVRFKMIHAGWSRRTIEVQLFGTAIAGPTAAPQTPWLSDLSGQEWYALHRAGYDPAGLVYGHCAWFIWVRRQDMLLSFDRSNTERRYFSDALLHCRNRANGAVYAMARERKAVGVVGMHLTRSVEFMAEGEHHQVRLHMIGTAIHLRPDGPKSVVATGTVLSLRDGRIKVR
jgi:uncharacterized protein YbjQ (UPF0145 family)